MKDQPRPHEKLVGWVLVAAAAYLIGAALAGAASMLGVTDFPGDRRGEWAPLAAPLLGALSLLPGFYGIRILVRGGYPLWQVTAVSVLLIGATICWLSWRFSYAAT